jgi:formate-dependent nitrite reductase cytochrome c552 subunit
LPQIFRPSSNKFSLISIIFAVGLVLFMAVSAYAYFQSSYHTSVGIIHEQPLPFSHQHHVQGMGLDCRFCHSSVEKSNSAGMPSTEVCLSCHTEVYRDSKLLSPLHESFQRNKPLQWSRVHQLPDHVYFNHSIHIKRGVSCQSCHGDVEHMPFVSKQESLSMKWCLSCHLHPEKVSADIKEDVSSCYTCHR